MARWLKYSPPDGESEYRCADFSARPGSIKEMTEAKARQLLADFPQSWSESEPPPAPAPASQAWIKMRRIKALNPAILRGKPIAKGETHDLPELEAWALVAGGAWKFVKGPPKESTPKREPTRWFDLKNKKGRKTGAASDSEVMEA